MYAESNTELGKPMVELFPRKTLACLHDNATGFPLFKIKTNLLS